MGCYAAAQILGGNQNAIQQQTQGKARDTADTTAKLAALKRHKLVLAEPCLPTEPEYEWITKILEAQQLSIQKD